MENLNQLSDRQKAVLEIIIGLHIRSAAPIGSAYVSDMLDVSSATVRNVMGELEDMGYICKPHTSAGRIPTADGYRYYVDNLLKIHDVSCDQRDFIENESRNAGDSIEAVLDKISHILSVMTRHTGIACLSSLQFYLEGASNMINYPEFKDPGKMVSLLRLIDEKEELVRLLNDDLRAEGVKIHISEESRFEILKDLSFITSSYRINDSRRGSLGVIGPVRMDYSNCIPLVDFLSRTVEDIFERMEEL